MQSIRFCRSRLQVIAGAVVFLFLGQLGLSQDWSERELQFFESSIRPLLVKQCYECHSNASGKAEGGLRVDSRAGILRGGDSGPAVVVGQPAKSLLLRAVDGSHDELVMPPKDTGRALSNAEVTALTRWISVGLPDTRTDAAAPVDSTTDEASTWWAFQPINNGAVPNVRSEWPRGDIDHFIAIKLQEAGLFPAPRANPNTLLRRLHYDMTGLPPTTQELDEFERLARQSGFDNAYASRVDALLASRQFAEHWGRHWLDVARFAESTGREINLAYPYAFRYRDYVIDSIHNNKPYDLFLREQIAGDLMLHRDAKQEAEHLAATGFLAIGSRALNEMNPIQFALDQADEQIDAVFQATMGLTVACARCHDHKFDPISQRDYTAVAGIFLSTKTLFGVPNARQGRNSSKPLALPNDAGLGTISQPLAKSEIDAMLVRYREFEQELEELRLERFRAFQASKDGSPPSNAARNTQRRIAIEAQKAQLEARIMEYDDDGNPIPLAMGVIDKPQSSNAPMFARFVARDIRRDGFESIGDSPFFARGEVELAGDRIARSVPSLFGDSDAYRIPNDTSGRYELASWITSRENPMTARVAANRVWNWLVGQGLVTSIDNFGSTGDLPSHPELLDYLAHSLQQGWDLKRLVRDIVMSATYQQSTQFNEQNFAWDPENRMLWRANQKRLEAESIRDSILLAAGKLDTKPPLGSSVARNGTAPIDRPPVGRFNYRRPATDDGFLGRSIYLGLPRDMQPEILSLFDMPDGNTVQGKREVTNVPAQSLFMLNSPWVSSQALALAERVTTKFPGKSLDSFQSRLEFAYALTLSRRPTREEAAAAKELVSQLGSNASTAWSSLARGLFASAEFRYID